jgi:hypothetical protein
VDPATPGGIRIDCTLAELGKMQPLNVQEVTTGGKSSGTAFGHAGRYSVEDSERAPDGTGVLRQDQRVEATDGKIGKLSGVAIDDDARITDFYTRLDRHGSHEVLLPTSDVSYVDRTTVYLLIDKRQVESQPARQDAGQQPSDAPSAAQKPWWRFWSR